MNSAGRIIGIAIMLLFCTEVSAESAPRARMGEEGTANTSATPGHTPSATNSHSTQTEKTGKISAGRNATTGTSAAGNTISYPTGPAMTELGGSTARDTQGNVGSARTGTSSGATTDPQR